MNRNTAQFFKTSVGMIRPGIEPSQLALMVRAHPILYHLAGVEESLNRNALLLRLRVGRTCPSLPPSGARALSPNYGPWAKYGPRSHFIRSGKMCCP